jgi:tRNA (cmo5U34)-methyltransferase
MGTLNAFDRIAPVYDALATLAFGGAIRRSQLWQLTHLPPSGRVAILGGGTGWIADSILKTTSARILYVEASSRMISFAKAKLAPWGDRVQYVHGTEADLPQDGSFQVVVANFYFDLFEDDSLPGVLAIIRGALHDDGKLLVADFVDETSWHRKFLRLMYRFFGWATGMRSVRLPRWDSITSAIFTPQVAATFFNGFIRSVVYKKRHTA